MNRLEKLALCTLLSTTLCACSTNNNEPGTVSYTIDSGSISSWNNSFKPYNNQTGKLDKFSNLRIYQIMVESFQNGNDSINYDTGYGNSNHKGDLQGIINALPYIKDLGMNAIWMTPIFESAPEGQQASMLDATGYFTRDYYKIDRRFGDEKKLHELINKAHDLGLYVILDGVFGHFRTDLNNTSPKGQKVSMTDKCLGGNFAYWTPPKGTACANFNDKGKSIKYMEEVAAYYVKEFQIDGWRLDQAYQVPPEGLRAIKKSVEEASKNTTYKNNKGKFVHPLGYIVGEIWSDNGAITRVGYGSDENPILDSNFDFAMRYGIVQTLAQEERGKREQSGFNLEQMLKYDENNLPNHAYPNLMITNHDLVRFGDLIQRAGLENSYDKRVKLALSYLSIAHSGPITHYYGEEIGQEVPNYSKYVETMGYRDDHVSRDNGKITDLNEKEKALKDLFTFMMKIRSSHGAISNGHMDILKVKRDLFSIRKTFKGDDTFFYLMNLNNTDTLKITLGKDVVNSEDLTQLYNKNCQEAKKNADGSFTIYIEPLSFQILQTGNNKKVCHL